MGAMLWAYVIKLRFSSFLFLYGSDKSLQVLSIQWNGLVSFYVLLEHVKKGTFKCLHPSVILAHVKRGAFRCLHPSAYAPLVIFSRPTDLKHLSGNTRTNI